MKINIKGFVGKKELELTAILDEGEIYLIIMM